MEINLIIKNKEYNLIDTNRNVVKQESNNTWCAYNNNNLLVSSYYVTEDGYYFVDVNNYENIQLINYLIKLKDNIKLLLDYQNKQVITYRDKNILFNGYLDKNYNISSITYNIKTNDPIFLEKSVVISHYANYRIISHLISVINLKNFF